MKGKMTKLLVAALCVVLLITALAVYATAQTDGPSIVVYVGGEGASDSNTGAKDSPVATLIQAYKLVCGVENGITTNKDAHAYIVLSGVVEAKDPNNSNNFNIPASGSGKKATYTHAGKLILTSVYDGVDYRTTANAALKNTRSDTYCYFQLGGETVWENMVVDVSSAYGLCIYAGENFTIADTVTTTGVGSSETKFVVCGGYCRVSITDPVTLTVNGGTVSKVSPVPNGAGHGHCTGNNVINIGGNAAVGTVLAGPITAKNSPKTIASTTVTVSGDAVVNTFNNAGAGAVANSTLVLAGGTVVDAIQSANVQKAYLQASGLSGEFTVPTKPKYESLTVTGNSDITLTAALSSDIALIVESGSTVTLAEGDTHTQDGGEGTVIYTHEHNWILDSEKSTTGSCTQAGTNAYYCDIGSCSVTKSESAGFVHSFADGVCSFCGGNYSKVYVRDGGTGDGYTASTAVGSLEDAYAALLDRTDIGTNADTEGTIVLCGTLTIDQHFNYNGDIGHAGSITYTGKGYNGTLLIYAESKSALTPNDEHRFQLGGPTVMEELTIDRGSASAGVSLTIYTGTSLVMAETVEVINTNWAGTYVEPVEGLTDEQIASIELSAHRGYQPMGPENSILSFTAAGQLGFAYIETDVYMTSDGELICIHDSTLDRTTNGSGNVMNMTYAEILQYRIDTAAYGYNINEADEDDLYVPTFREYLAICKEYGCKPFIEIKDGRRATLEAIVEMALEYFDAEDIVMSGGSLSHLQTSHEINQDMFIHLIWGDTSDAGYTNSINVLSQMKNSDGQIYAGIAFNIQNLHVESNFNTAKSWIEKANAAGLQTCLRGADDMTQVRKMFELGIDYYPTNTTSPEKLQQLKQGTEGGYSFASASGGKLFIRGGNRGQEIAGDVSITLLGGIYDFVAPSSAEGICTGSYSVTVGGNAFVSRLIAGETNSSATGDREASVVTVQDSATVNDLYLAGDYANTQSVTVNILGGTVKAMSENRGKPGTAGDLTVNIASTDLLPATINISNSSLITGTKVLTIGGTGELGNVSAWDKLIANDGAVITLTGTHPEALERVGSGKFLVHDQSITFTESGSIVEDGAAVELGDISCNIVGSGTVTVNWYADNNGEKGEALNLAPVNAGTYWVGVSIAEAADDNEALYHAAVAEQTIRFTIVHTMVEVQPSEPTATEDGNIAHWKCTVCGKLFDAQVGGKELAAEDVVIPATGEPEPPASSEPETSEPETSEPETSEPETSEPETSEPETSEPETSEPETSETETSEPETSEPETSTPETTVPETTVPEETKPDDTETIIVYAKVPEGWENPGIWAWNDKQENAFEAWPGLAMTKGEDGWWYAEVPAWVENVIINANGGAVQTADLDLAVTGENIWVEVSVSADGKVDAVIEYSTPDTGDNTALIGAAAVMLLMAAAVVTAAGSKKRFF